MAFLRRRFLAWIGMAITSFVLVIGWQFVNLSPATSDTTLNVYAAVSLTDALNAIEDQYNSSTGASINFVNRYDSSGILLNEIEGGAPADIFISAAVNQINTLYSEGKLASGSINNIVTNTLVLIAPTTPPVSDGSASVSSFGDLTNDNITGIAIGDPTIVPAGNYATQVFDNLGITDAIGYTPKAGQQR